jgi:hypothetical protein
VYSNKKAKNTSNKEAKNTSKIILNLESLNPYTS